MFSFPVPSLPRSGLGGVWEEIRATVSALLLVPLVPGAVADPKSRVCFSFLCFFLTPLASSLRLMMAHHFSHRRIEQTNEKDFYIPISRPSVDTCDIRTKRI